VSHGFTSRHLPQARDRAGTVSDPFGHQWTIATHKEDVTPEELKKRGRAFFE
jgi:PhnB protein